MKGISKNSKVSLLQSTLTQPCKCWLWLLESYDLQQHKIFRNLLQNFKPVVQKFISFRFSFNF